MTNSFNFYLKRMQQAVECHAHIMPNKLSFNEFIEWMKSNA
jgi:hypothetical protein